MTLDHFRDLVQQRLRPDADAGSARVAVPVFVRRSADLLTPVAAYLKLRQPGTLGFLLESVEGGEKLARYSFLGVGPHLVLEADGEHVRLTRPALSVDGGHGGDGAPQTETRAGSVYDVLGELLADVDEVKIPDLPRFTGGGVGYLGYDTVRLLERLPDAPPDPLGLPDALWAFYDTLVAFDHVRHQMLLIATVFADADTDLDDAYAEAQHRLARLEQRLAEGTPEPGPAIQLRADAIASNFARGDFEAAVETAKQHIVEGDIFQVVLSQRFAMPFRGDAFNLYRALRQVNPSPYLFYLDLHSADGQNFALVGSSPEVLVRVEEGRAEVLPIAGTRKRGADAEEDAALETDLLADPKERAEHLMLVDLGRNDLGRVCTPGTVEVDRYAYVERYSHVMHIVSAVSGMVDERRTAMQVLGATFPAGTVSGAPKIRAMEIIDTLEPEKRGVYAGAVGYADYSGNMDTCIAIRTMVVQRDGPHHGTAYVQAGAGIVADSDPASEYEETRNKARALHQAMRLASEGLL